MKHKKHIEDISEVRQNWKNEMASPKRKMSRGAQNLVKVYTVSHKDQWRRNKGKNKK